MYRNLAHVLLHAIIKRKELHCEDLGFDQDATKMLKKSGCYIVEHGKEHDKWYSPITGKHFRVWRHPGKEIPTGTAHKIMKDAGLK